MTIPENITDQLTSSHTAMLIYIDQREPVLLAAMSATYEETLALEWLDEQGLIAVTKSGSCAVVTRPGHEIVQELLKPSTGKSP